MKIQLKYYLYKTENFIMLLDAVPLYQNDKLNSLWVFTLRHVIMKYSQWT